MTKPISATNVIFSDDFSANGPIDAARWNFNRWDSGGSFYGNTQQRQELPSAQDGALRLRLDTFNPSDKAHTTFLGSEAISLQTFSVGSGLAFEAKARYAQVQPGIIGGFFTFAGPADTHDEIDFEALSNDNSKIQTNIYHNEPLGNGHPISYPISGSLTDYHTYRIEWLPNAVRWLVDGVVVRTETQLVPDKAMFLHLNIWGPPAEWPTGSSTLKPAATQGQNQTFELWIDYVKVEQLSGLSGTDKAERLRGTKQNDWIDGQHGHDELYGGTGHDTILGGSGRDTISGQAGHDHLQGGNGHDRLLGGSGNDRLEGATDNDSLKGDSGNDTLIGGAGHDTLWGGTGADRLDGGAGNDTLRGDGGNDRIVGGLGRDQLWGGSGVDVFDFNSVQDSRAGSQRDVIHDFESKHDRIDLRGIDANELRKGDQAFTWVGKDAPLPFCHPAATIFLKTEFTGKAGQLRYDSGVLMGDTDGDRKADFEIKVAGYFSSADVIL